MPTDPFTQVIEKFWELIEADVTLAALIKEGNRRKFTGDGQDPIKSSVQDGDLPELVIVPAGGPMSPHFSSTAVEIVERFNFVLTTGNMKVDESIYPIKWALFKRLAEDTNNNLGLAFVTNAMLLDEAIEAFDSSGEDQRGTKGWSLGLTAEVQMTFNREGNVVQDPA